MARAGRPKLPERVFSQMRIEKTLHSKLRIIASRESRSINAQIEYFAQQGVDRYEKEFGTIVIEPEAEDE